MNFLNIVSSPKEYAEAAVIAQKAGHEMLARLQWMTLEPKTILDIGCGTGEMSLALQQRYPAAKIISIDSSMLMAEHTQQLVLPSPVICAGGECLPLRTGSIDLVFANFFLPWQQDVKAVINEWLRVLRGDGVLMLSALGVDTLQEWREVLHAEDTPNLVDMHDVGDALIQAGFSEPVLDVNHYKVTYADKMRLLQDIRSAEMWFPTPEIDLNALVPPALQAGQRWQLTYEVIYAHAFAPMAGNEFSASSDGIVKIPLAHLRRRRV